jgi:hypothetical protein
MPLQWQGIVLGAIIGFVSSIGILVITRFLEKRDQRERINQLLSSIVKEIEEGINRCQILIKLLNRKKPKISFSRIYTQFWDSTVADLGRYVEDLEVLKLLHQIYYRFDLINFNMEKNRFGTGARFAKDYFEEIQSNLARVKARMSTSKKKVMKLSVKAVMFTSGIGWGLAVLIVGVLNMIFAGYGEAYLKLMAALFVWYHASGDVVDLIIGIVWALVVGAVSGMFFALLYNAFVGTAPERAPQT